jgi:hypothetical protein
MMSNTNPTKNPGGEPRQRIPASNDELVDHYRSAVFQHLADICTIHNIIKDDLLTGVMY